MATRKGRKTAATIQMQLNTLLEEFEYSKDVEEARAALAEVESEGTVSWDEVKSSLSYERANSPQRHKGHREAPKPKT